MGTGLSKRDGKGKILDNHNEICYSYEHKSSCELYFYSLQLFFCRFDVWKKDINSDGRLSK